MVKTSSSGNECYAYTKKLNPCSSPVIGEPNAHPEPAGSVSTPCSSSVPTQLRHSRGLTALRANYSQLLQDYADWSAQKSACRSNKVSGSDQAITPEASAACADCRQQSRQKLPEQQFGEQSRPNVSGPQTWKPECSQVRCTSSPASRHGYTTPPPTAATSPAKTLKSKRKSKPRPAWRNSITISSTLQHEDHQPTAADQGDLIPAGTADPQPCLQAGYDAAVSTPLKEQLFGLQSPEQYNSKQAATPLSISVQQPDHDTALQAAAQGGCEPKLLLSAPTPCDCLQQPVQSTHAEGTGSSARLLLANGSSQTECLEKTVQCAPQTSGSMCKESETSKVGTMKTMAATNAVKQQQLQQQQQVQQIKPQRKWVIKLDTAAVPKTPGCHPVAAVDSQRASIPLLPLQKLPPIERTLTAAAQCSTNTATSRKASRSAPASARSGNRGLSTPATCTLSVNVAQLASEGSHSPTSRNISELSSCGITFRRHSAADAEQDRSEAALRSAEVTRQTVTAECSSGDALQHIKQLQMTRRKSIGSGSDCADLPDHRVRAPTNPPYSKASASSQLPLPAAADTLHPASCRAYAALPPLPAAQAAADMQGSKVSQTGIHKRANGRGSSVPTTSRSSSEPPQAPQRSNSIGLTFKAAAQSLTAVSSSGRNAVLPELTPSWRASGHSSSSGGTQAQVSAASWHVGDQQRTAGSCKSLSTPVSAARGRNGSDTDAEGGSSRQQQAAAPCSVTRGSQHLVEQSYSSNDSQPSSRTSIFIDDGTGQVGRCSNSCSSSAAHVTQHESKSCTSSVGQAAAGAESAYEQTSSTISSLSSSDADDVGDAADAGAGLVCEPSSYGICCENAAGAVHLLRPALTDKLARLRNRICIKHATMNDDGQPTLLLNAAVTTVTASGAAAACGDSAAPGEAALLSDGIDSTAAVVEESCEPSHSSRSPEKVVLPMLHNCCQESMGDIAITWHGVKVGSRPDDAACKHYQEQQGLAAAAERVRARWQIPAHVEDAMSQQQHIVHGVCDFMSHRNLVFAQHCYQQTPHQQSRTQQQQQQQQVPDPGWQQQPCHSTRITSPKCQQQLEESWLPRLQAQEAWHETVRVTQQHLPVASHIQQQQQRGISTIVCSAAHPRTVFCRDPSHITEQHCNAANQYCKLGSSQPFHQVAAQQHWQCQQPEPCWPHYYPAAGDGCRQQQLQWKCQQPQAQLQQQWPASSGPCQWVPGQQHQHQQPQPAPPGGIVAPPPGALASLGNVRNQAGMMQQPATLPNTGGKRQSVAPSDDQQIWAISAPSDTAANGSEPSTAACSAQATVVFKAGSADQGGSGTSVPTAGVLSRFTDFWVDRRQQHQQQTCTVRETSAAAMARQRQEAQRQLFQGMPLEAVLKSAKQSMLQPRVCM